MEKLSTPHSILYGFGLIALAILFNPLVDKIVTPAEANTNNIHRLQSQYFPAFLEAFKNMKSCKG